MSILHYILRPFLALYRYFFVKKRASLVAAQLDLQEAKAKQAAALRRLDSEIDRLRVVMREHVL